MSPKAIEKLKAAAKFVGDENQKGTPPEQIILAMISLYGAKRWDADYAGHKLQCGGVTGSCTTSRDAGLLRSWVNCAERRMQREQLA